MDWGPAALLHMQGLRDHRFSMQQHHCQQLKLCSAGQPTKHLRTTGVEHGVASRHNISDELSPLQQKSGELPSLQKGLAHYEML